jgi:hypothetical protein
MPRGSSKEGMKQIFFEKKNQKTFIPAVPSAGDVSDDVKWLGRRRS